MFTRFLERHKRLSRRRIRNPDRDGGGGNDRWHHRVQWRSTGTLQRRRKRCDRSNPKRLSSIHRMGLNKAVRPKTNKT